jgi:hypothetical protein
MKIPKASQGRQGRIRTPPPRRRHDVAKLLECASPPRPAMVQRPIDDDELLDIHSRTESGVVERVQLAVVNIRVRQAGRN